MFESDLPPHADVVIIGGGVTGCSIARELSKYDLKIVLIERNPDVAFEVSAGNMGIIHPFIPQMNTLKAKLCLEGNSMFDKLSKELDFPFKRVGLLIVSLNHIESLFLRFVYLWLKRKGIKVEKIGRSKLFEMEPNINKKARFAIYVPTAGVTFPEKYVIALAENASQNGVKIITNTEVISIKNDENRLKVGTNRGDITAKFVINAAGLYADEICKKAGLKPFEMLPGVGVMIVFNQKLRNYINHLVVEVPFRVDPKTKGGAAGITYDGRLIWGPNLRMVSEKTEDHILESDIRDILNKFRRLFPNVGKEYIEYYFLGVRPASRHEDFIIGESELRGFINVAGIQSPGLTASPAIAKLVVKILEKAGLKLVKKQNFNPYRRSIPNISSMDVKEMESVIQNDKRYSNVICSDCLLTEGEVVEAIQRGARTIISVLNRVGLHWSSCFGGNCIYEIAKILSRELNIPLNMVSYSGHGTELIKGDGNE